MKAIAEIPFLLDTLSKEPACEKVIKDFLEIPTILALAVK